MAFAEGGKSFPQLVRASAPAISWYQPHIASSHTPQAQMRTTGISFIPRHPLGTQGVMGKHPHSTKIELCLLLIPDEQVLLFKGLNPLQSTQWNPNPLSPLPLSTVCVFSPPVFLPAFCLSWISKGNKRIESCMSCGNLHEENHLRNRSFHHPSPGESV